MEEEGEGGKADATVSALVPGWHCCHQPKQPRAAAGWAQKRNSDGVKLGLRACLDGRVLGMQSGASKENLSQGECGGKSKPESPSQGG